MSFDKSSQGSGPELDLQEATRLIEALEHDLGKISGDAHDIQRIRDEVETLRNVLNSPVRRHHWVRDGLHSLRDEFEGLLDTAVSGGLKASQYIAEIGRILGM